MMRNCSLTNIVIIITKILHILLIHFIEYSSCQNDVVMLSPCQLCDRCKSLLTCTNATWIIGRGTPTQQFVNTTLIRVVNTTTNCFDECRRQTGCLSFTFRTPASMICSLYRSNITSNNLTLAGDPFWYGTITCCDNIDFTFFLLKPCTPCIGCPTNTSCNSFKWLSGLGLPDPIISKVIAVKSISNTSSCFNECQLDKGCSSYSFSTGSPGLCRFYSNEVTQSSISVSTNTNTTTTATTNITISSITNITAIMFGTRRCCGKLILNS
ncbi:unnamed protein product [Trichobilharzia szidati]|nr:unnamed protein product [Trichobilharzia szidati]